MGNRRVDRSALSRRARAFFAARGQYDHGDVATVVARPRSVAYLQPRQARQHPVEYDKIGRRVGEARFRLVAAIDMRGEPRRVEGRTGLSREIGFSRDGEGRQITPM